MMSFRIGGPTQQPPALPRNLTQSLGLPNYTSQYGSGLAQDLRGQLFLFTGNPAVSPLIETMAYSQIPNFSMPVAQFSPNNPLNTSIDSLFNAPLLQNGTLGGGMAQGNGNMMGGGGMQPQGSIFAQQPQQQQNFGFPQQGGFQPIPQQQNFQPAQQGGFQPAQQGAVNTVGSVIAGLQQQISQITSLLQSLLQGGGGGVQQPQQQQQGGFQSLVSPVGNGLSQQQSNLQTLMNPMNLSQYTSMVGGNPQAQMPPAGQGFANPTMQGYGMQGASPQGYGYGNASPTMQGYGMPQQQQYNPYMAQGNVPPYATAGGQIMYR
jgi:hypothetical protein